MRTSLILSATLCLVFTQLQAAPKEWREAAPREEIRPKFEYAESGGRENQERFIISADEREGLKEYVAAQQYAFKAIAFGLTDEQARSAPSVSSLSIGGLIKHVTHCQRGWMERVAAAPELCEADRRQVGHLAGRVAEHEPGGPPHCEREEHEQGHRTGERGEDVRPQPRRPGHPGRQQRLQGAVGLVGPHPLQHLHRVDGHEHPGHAHHRGAVGIEDDVGAALLSCVVADGPPGAYNIAADDVISTLDVVRALGLRPLALPARPAQRLARLAARVPGLPSFAQWVEAMAQPAVMDTTLARTSLRWQPRWSAVDALRDTVL